MTLEQLNRLNEQFQQRAAEITELIPGSNLLAFSSALIRSAKKLDNQFRRALAAKTEMGFYQQLEKTEEEMDEIIYVLDRLDVQNRKAGIQMITDFVKNGFELLSVYSLCCDQVIERRLKKANELE